MGTARSCCIPITLGCSAVLLGSFTARADPPGEEVNGRGVIFVEARDLKVPAAGRFTGLLAVNPETRSGESSPGQRSREKPSPRTDAGWLASDAATQWRTVALGLRHQRRASAAPFFEGRGIPSWSGDSKHIIIGSSVGTGRFVTWRVNADGTGAMKLPLPDTDFATDYSRDGMWILADSLAR